MYLLIPLLITSSFFFFFSSRRRHTRFSRDWSSDVCSSDLDGSARQVHDEGDEERRTQGQQREPGEQLGASRPRPNPTTQLASVREGPRTPPEDRGDDAKEPQRDRERRKPAVDRVVGLEQVEAVRRQEDVSGAGRDGECLVAPEPIVVHVRRYLGEACPIHDV